MKFIHQKYIIWCGEICKINKNTRCLNYKCKHNLDKDINGSMNILFKNLSSNINK